MTDLLPGLELDAAVAERVMGWQVSESAPDPDNLPAVVPWRDLGVLTVFRKRALRSDGSPVALPGDFWSPSTRIQDVWEVVEAMSRSTKESWEIHYYSTGAVVSFDYEGGRDRLWRPGVHQADAGTLSHAICLTALEAVS